MIGVLDGCARVADLRVHEGQSVMAGGEIRAEIDRPFQLDDRLVVTALQPQRAAHGPMRGRIAVVRHQALTGSLECAFGFPFALGPALERVLPVRE